ncbi:group-specific protein [Fictibacillus sp. KU28468]|uniref:group-specific protein n=1 Tax=Fictibacillus sp. KU28468 TaxID=2991053 RepID=UPI00223DF816|nr:group-specific protein [Fictibacillus sp. KU28468]UZJ78644.1 group-specific protein [Fictibacillus sp. KU28468]
MKFYIASSFNNIPSVTYVSEKLKIKGFIQTYDWTKERASTIEDLKDIGQKEREAVIEADFLVVMLPAGKGSHIELGIALGTGKKVYLYSPNEAIYDFEATSTFYHLPEVEHVMGTLDDLVYILTGSS